MIEDYHKLYLWGEVFDTGELDKALEQSDDLRDSVVDLLGTIGHLLLRGESLNCCFDNWSPGYLCCCRRLFALYRNAV